MKTIFAAIAAIVISISPVLASPYQYGSAIPITDPSVAPYWTDILVPDDVNAKVYVAPLPLGGEAQFLSMPRYCGRDACEIRVVIDGRVTAKSWVCSDLSRHWFDGRYINACDTRVVPATPIDCDNTEVDENCVWLPHTWRRD